MKKIACIFIVAILVLSLLPGFISSQEKEIVPLEEQSDRVAIDGTDLFWDYQHTISKLYPGLTGDALASALNPYKVDSAPPDVIGDTEDFWIQWGPDADHVDQWKEVASTCRGVGTYCSVFVEDVEWTNGHIDQTVVDQIIATFDGTIYPIESANFRALPDYKGQDKVTIFLSDIQDGWGTGDPVQTLYIAGYFHSLNYTDDLHSNDRHLVNIDTYPGIYYGGTADPSHALGTVAHEYQHLLHFWSDPDETTWLNEGQSDYAEFLTLGILEDSHLAYFYIFHSANLESWGSGDASVLESYGASLSFMMYLYENFGGDALMSAIHNDPLNGRSSIDNQLTATTFADVYKDWTLANLLDDPSLIGPNSGAALGFTSYDVGSSDTWLYTVTNYIWGPGLNWDWGPYPYSDPLFGDVDTYPSPDFGHWADTQQQLDANYFIYEANGSPSIFNFDFMGNGPYSADYQIAVPSVGDLEWYSNGGNGWYDGNEHTLDYTFDFSACASPQLVFDTWVDIEEGWDFGYVMVSTDGGATWAYLDDVGAYMSDYRHPEAYVGVGCAYAFTGEAQGWLYDATFDLSAYGNTADVKVRFSYVTDDAYAPFGWIVDNIRVSNGVVILDGSDASDATWTSNGWTHTDTIHPLDWDVYLVGYPYGGVPDQGDIYSVNLNATSGDGSLSIPGLGSYYSHFVVVPSMVTSENIPGNFQYWHNAWTTSVSAPAAVSTFALFNNALMNVNEVLDKTLYLFSEAESNGHDVTEVETLLESVNEDISKANTGVNWVFRSGKILHAIETLNEIMEILTN